MWTICFEIDGKRHCFEVPLLIDRPVHRPPPENLPQLELAVTVLECARVVKAVDGPSPLTNQLSEVATQYIQQLQNSLPKGVSLNQAEKV